MPGTFYSSYLASGLLADRALYPSSLGDAAVRRARARAASARSVDPALLVEMRTQLETLRPSAAQRRNLQQMAGAVSVVVTGQQVGLCLGPLYTLHKAATAVVLARQLTAESGAPCLPLFWLQTEDQDFAEIAGCAVPRTDGDLMRLRLGDDPTLARCSVAQRRLGADVSAQLDALADGLYGLPHADETMALLRDWYRPGEPLGRAFAGVLSAMFADHGLLLLDPRTPAVARLGAPVLRRALEEHAHIDAALGARGDALRAAGLSEQVRLRAGSPLFFFHAGDANGPRHRLTARDGGFVLDGSGETIDAAALAAALERDPLRFSTSALLRPMLQDTLLPTAAYVGGPAEVDYFAQLPPLYDCYGLEPPLLAPRARFRLVPSALASLLGKLGLPATAFERPREEILAALATAHGDDGPAASWLAELETRLDGYQPLDPGLARAVTRTRASLRRNLDRLVRRHQRTLAARDSALAARVDRAQRWLFPDGAPQERVHAMPYYAALVGPRQLADKIIEAVDPLKPEPRDLHL